MRISSPSSYKLKQLQGHFNTNTTNSPCRVVYVSSTSAESTKFSLEDYQGIHSKHPYESSKRAGDLMVLGLGLRRSSYTSVSADCNNDQNNNSNHTIPLPEVYSCSPGCVATNIVAGKPPPPLFFFYSSNQIPTAIYFSLSLSTRYCSCVVHYSASIHTQNPICRTSTQYFP